MGSTVSKASSLKFSTAKAHSNVAMSRGEQRLRKVDCAGQGPNDEEITNGRKIRSAIATTTTTNSM